MRYRTNTTAARRAYLKHWREQNREATKQYRARYEAKLTPEQRAELKAKHRVHARNSAARRYPYNRERILAAKKLKRLSNPHLHNTKERIRYHQRLIAHHRAQIKKIRRHLYYLEHKETERAHRTAWARAHREHSRAYGQAWDVAHKKGQTNAPVQSQPLRRTTR